ncbi:MAG: hypothetical protein IKY83_13275 [Proteobacteria bacterium]|nr:hypothetical protein [Pseudomonadota bacterium]
MMDIDDMEKMRSDLLRRIADYLFAAYRWACMDSPTGLEPKPLGLTIDMLEYQRCCHPVYARYCEMHGRTERGVSLLDYPPLPVEFFKRADVSPFSQVQTIAEFHSSGTTTGDRSIHRFRDVGLLHRAIFFAFTIYVARIMSPRTRVFSLMPSYEDNPHSSLGYMLTQLVRTLGGEGSDFFFSMEDGLASDRLFEALRQAARDEVPVHLLGPAFSYVELLDRLGDEKIASAPESCLFETGGYKGRTREIPKRELRDSLSASLGIERRRIYGEYGMCELTSQGYEICALNTRGELPDEGLFTFPVWMKCILYNPETMAPVLPGNCGQIALFDLCNLDSAGYILTGDIGIMEPLSESLRARVPGHPKHALRLLGRAENAMPKGCSMSWEEWAGR